MACQEHCRPCENGGLRLAGGVLSKWLQQGHARHAGTCSTPLSLSDARAARPHTPSRPFQKVTRSSRPPPPDGSNPTRIPHLSDSDRCEIRVGFQKWLATMMVTRGGKKNEQHSFGIAPPGTNLNFRLLSDPLPPNTMLRGEPKKNDDSTLYEGVRGGRKSEVSYVPGWGLLLPAFCSRRTSA